MELGNIRQQTRTTAQSKPPPDKCQVEVIFLGKDNSGLNAAKEILIASFVKNMINKGNISIIG